MSSFGFGGTNAHVILEEAPRAEVPADTAPPPAATLLVLSAHTPAALAATGTTTGRSLARRAAGRHRGHGRAGRAALPCRLALVATSPADTRQTLAQFAQAGADPHVLTGHAVGQPAVAWLLADLDGPTSDDVGPRLAQSCPSFRSLWDEVQAAAMPHADRAETAAVLPLALGRYWHALGLEPRLLLGLGSGEYVAACLAGVLTLPDTFRLLAARERRTPTGSARWRTP